MESVRGVDIPYVELEVLFKRCNDILGDNPWSRTLDEAFTPSDTRRASTVRIEQLGRADGHLGRGVEANPEHDVRDVEPRLLGARRHLHDAPVLVQLDAVRTARRALERDREHRALGEGSATAS